MNKYFETIFYGRGGLGAKSSAQFLAEAAILEGNEIQAFPEYGPERRGAPVRSFVRFSKSKIRIHQPIKHPDCVIIIDDSLFEIKKELKEYKDTIFIINSEKERKDFKEIIDKNKVYIINASKIAKETIKRNSPNTVLIGAFSRIFKNIKLENLKKVIEMEFRKKAKIHYIEPNKKALEKGYNYFKNLD